MIAAGTAGRGVIRIHRSEARDGIRRVQVKRQMFGQVIIVCPLDAVAVARLL